MTRLMFGFALLMMSVDCRAAEQSYELSPVKIAANSYVFIGQSEDFSARNGGNIVNTGFIVTDEGVVVIDTGPSRLYGLEMRKAIASVTPLPVVRVVNTHLHPDHVFGNQAFAEIEIEALPPTTEALRALGEEYAANMYRLVGPWMKGTELRLPSVAPPKASMRLGGHVLEIIALAGHSEADLVVLDHTAKVLWASDIVFLDRAPTTPNADVKSWLASLDAIEALDFETIVPGHGRPATDRRAIAQTRDWLIWLDHTLNAAAGKGLTMTEAMALPMPERFKRLALAREEFVRSVAHLYPALELAAMQRAN